MQIDYAGGVVALVPGSPTVAPTPTPAPTGFPTFQPEYCSPFNVTQTESAMTNYASCSFTMGSDTFVTIGDCASSCVG